MKIQKFSTIENQVNTIIKTSFSTEEVQQLNSEQIDFLKGTIFTHLAKEHSPFVFSRYTKRKAGSLVTQYKKTIGLSPTSLSVRKWGILSRETIES